jgi:hypothetical protein
MEVPEVSLTEAELVFAGVNESGVNDLLKAFFTARPRFLTYATPSMAPPPLAFVSVPTIAFPGVPGGIQYKIELTIPSVDFAPDSSGGGSPLPVGAMQVGIRTTVTLTVGCVRRVERPNPEGSGSLVPISTTLEVWARGKLIATYFSPGVGEISFQVDDVEIVDIKPDSLESVLECILRMVLQAVLLNVKLPFHALTAGAFALALLRGPEVEDDQVKIYGTV